MRVAAMLSFVVLLGLAVAAPAVAAKGDPPYTTGFTKWRGADGGFASWSRSGVVVDAGGALRLDPANLELQSDPYAAGAYYGGNYYNAGAYLVGEATSPVVTAPFTEAIASWNASTPDGTWIETLISVDVGGRWSKWFNLGIWASGSGTIQRHSVRLQGDNDGFVAVDTFIAAKKVAPVAYRVKLRMFQAAGSTAVPSVRNVSVATSPAAPAKPAAPPGDPALWNRVLNVPECSQMVYPDGGEVWCSPTSTSMVLGYWSGEAGPCEARVRAAVNGVYDRIYDGHGNWPFNTAYAASAAGLEGYVARFTSMAQIEQWVAAGVPVVISFAWKKGELTGAGVPSSNGHLAVVVGFDASGNPIVNDPAQATDNDVQVTYLRSELEPLWLSTSGGTVYLMYPEGHAVPAL